MPKEQNGGLSFRLGQSFLSLPSIHPLWEGFGSQCLLGSTNLQLAREPWEPDRSLLLSIEMKRFEILNISGLCW